jgi:uncharacterized protein
MAQPSSPPFTPAAITHPAPVLLSYYILVALASLIAFPITMPMLYFRYHTMRYRFDDEGISMSWGILFRREINLTYRRIQDIHVTRNIFQRWLGLATVAIQTASGSATPEMSIEGVLEFEALRDYLYAQMRGAKGDAPSAPASDSSPDESARLLRQIADDLAAVRVALSAKGESPR